jgi:ABC-type molybdate transport system permease subunit
VWLLSRRWRFFSSAHAWTTGWLWLSLAVAWEFGFGLYIRGFPLGRVLHEYAFWQGRLWTLVLLATLVLPALVRALDHSRRRAP